MRSIVDVSSRVDRPAVCRAVAVLIGVGVSDDAVGSLANEPWELLLDSPCTATHLLRVGWRQLEGSRPLGYRRRVDVRNRIRVVVAGEPKYPAHCSEVSVFSTWRIW